jgi:hypothetical protein
VEWLENIAFAIVRIKKYISTKYNIEPKDALIQAVEYVKGVMKFVAFTTF